MDELGPGALALAAQQPDGIGGHRDDGADGDDAATSGGQDEAALVDGGRPQGGDGEDGSAGADRHLHAGRQKRMGGGVEHGEVDDRFVADRHPRLEEFVMDAVGSARQEPQP